jgi:hypothetical protein
MSYINSSGFESKMNLLDIDQASLLVAYDFVSGDKFHSQYLNNPYWATGAPFSGKIKGDMENFYKKSGSGFFNGSTSIEVSGSIPDDNFTFLFCYEKMRGGAEVLLSSAAGSGFLTSSGLSVGINDANKLYLEYWSPVYGRHSLDYEENISSKNLVFLSRQFGEFVLGTFDPIGSSLNFVSSSIDSLKYKHSDKFIIGAGSPAYWSSHTGIKSFSGFFDDFYCLGGVVQDSDLIHLFSGFYSASSSGEVSGVTSLCIETTILSGSGLSFGTGITGYETLTSYVTGYVPSGCFDSGYSYLVGTGITGYYNKYVEGSSDEGGDSSAFYVRTPLTGEIYTSGSTYVCTGSGLVVTPKYTTVPLTGLITGDVFVSTPSTSCAETVVYYSGGTEVDLGFISSLGFNSIYSFEPYENIKWCESFFYTGQPYFNINLKPVFDGILNDYTIPFSDAGSGLNLFFNNGQLMLESGWSSYLDFGIEKYNITGNVFLDKNIIRSNLYADSSDIVIYDSSDTISGESVFLPQGLSSSYGFGDLFSSNFSNFSIFLNGLKLVSGLDFHGDVFSFNVPPSSVLIRINNDYISSEKGYFSGRANHFSLGSSGHFANNCSQLYINGLRQLVDYHYVETSKWSILTGFLRVSSAAKQLVYSSSENFWNI